MLTEVGAPSTAGAYRYWGSVERQPVDFDAQARAWDGYLRAYQGDPRIEGIDIWNLLPFYNKGGQNEDWVMDIWKYDYDFNDKPAEKVLCRWFSKGTAALCKQ